MPEAPPTSLCDSSFDTYISLPIFSTLHMAKTREMAKERNTRNTKVSVFFEKAKTGSLCHKFWRLGWSQSMHHMSRWNLTTCLAPTRCNALTPWVSTSQSELKFSRVLFKGGSLNFLLGKSRSLLSLESAWRKGHGNFEEADCKLINTWRIFKSDPRHTVVWKLIPATRMFWLSIAELISKTRCWNDSLTEK